MKYLHTRNYITTWTYSRTDCWSLQINNSHYTNSWIERIKYTTQKTSKSHFISAWCENNNSAQWYHVKSVTHQSCCPFSPSLRRLRLCWGRRPRCFRRWGGRRWGGDACWGRSDAAHGVYIWSHRSAGNLDLFPKIAWKSCCVHSQEGDDEDSEAADQLLTSHTDADTTIIFTTGEGRSGSFFYQIFIY